MRLLQETSSQNVKSVLATPRVRDPFAVLPLS